jgi:hypothetical protein
MGSKRFTTVFCLVVLATANVQAAAQIESQNAATQKVASVVSSTTLPSSTEAAEVEPWIHPRMNDGLHERVAVGFEIAAELVQEVDSCSDLFADLGVDALETLASALYWPVISYRDAKEICRGRNLAFTTVGSGMTFICADFEKLSSQDAAVVIIHEALHTAGLKEKPQYRGRGIKTSREINSMVTKSCFL